MGKKKDKQEQQENNQQCNHKESPNEENKNNPKGVIILGVYIHCQGCKQDVLKSLRGFDGVEEIEIDEKNHKVMVKGKNADPLKVAERLRKKSGKHVELISPIPVPKKKEEKKEIKQEHKVIEVTLKLYMHCEGCAKDVKQCLHKMPGVQTVDPEMKNNLVKVKGSMDPQKLVDFISKKSGKHAEIVKSSNINKEKDEKAGDKKEKNEKSFDKKACSCHDYAYPPHLVYAPQLFSDENPNSCSIL